jgi:hypothetical protein
MDDAFVYEGLDGPVYRDPVKPVPGPFFNILVGQRGRTLQEDLQDGPAGIRVVEMVLL